MGTSRRGGRRPHAEHGDEKNGGTGGSGSHGDRLPLMGAWEPGEWEPGKWELGSQGSSLPQSGPGPAPTYGSLGARGLRKEASRRFDGGDLEVKGEPAGRWG